MVDGVSGGHTWAMDEIGPGVYHWSARHPNTGGTAHSHLLAGAGTLLDPMAPAEALELLREHRPERIVLTNRHHYRQADVLAAEFGVAALCPEPGMHEFAGDARAVEPYAPGQALGDGATAYAVGGICPDDFAVHYAADPGWLCFADGVIRREDGLDFVSDGLLGDDPPAIRAAILAGVQPLLELEFEGLLFAHGEPMASGGREALERFVDERG